MHEAPAATAARMPWGEPFIELMMSMRYASSSPSGPASVSRMWLMCAQHAMAPGVNKLELARMVHVWRVWRDDDEPYLYCETPTTTVRPPASPFSR